MRRAPVVLGATAAGVGLLFSYHTRPIRLSVPSAAGATHPPVNPATTLSPGPASPTTVAPTNVSPTTRSPTTVATTRSGTGQDVVYRYGDIQLRVSERGTAITAVRVVSEGATDPRSAEINSQAVPMLEQQAMSAQSARIDGVSGATFTSMAYQQALQSALDQLH